MGGSGVVHLKKRGLIYSVLRIGKPSFGTWNLETWRDFVWETALTLVPKELTCLYESPEKEQGTASTCLVWWSGVLQSYEQVWSVRQLKQCLMSSCGLWSTLKQMGTQNPGMGQVYWRWAILLFFHTIYFCWWYLFVCLIFLKNNKDYF